MKINKKRIKNIDKILSIIDTNNFYIVSENAEIKNIGFKILEVGEIIIPSGIGPISKFNKDGKEEIIIPKSKEEVIYNVPYHNTDWHGNPHSGICSRKYKRLKRKFIAPLLEKIFIKEKNKDRYILSKFYTACITCIPILVIGNALIFLLSIEIIKYIVLELILVSTIVLMILSNMKMDSENISIGWRDIKDLFELERTMKLIKPVNIAYIILLPYFCIRAFVIDAGTNNYFEVFMLIIINILLSLRNLKKIRTNFKLNKSKFDVVANQ